MTDPGPTYPPGATPGTSWHGALHQIAGPLVFVGLAGAAFACRRPWGAAAGGVVVLCFLATNVFVTLAYSGAWPEAPAGLFESLAVYAGLAFLATLAGKATSTRRPS